MEPKNIAWKISSQKVEEGIKFSVIRLING